MAEAPARASGRLEGPIERARAAAAAAVARARPQVEARAERLTLRVVDAFRAEALAASDFAASTGYGYDSVGRDKLDRVWAALLGAEAAIVRGQIASGTAAVAHMLFACARPGDELVVATGPPYDSVATVLDGGVGSLSAWGVRHRVLPFAEGAAPASLAAAMRAESRIVLIQRSRGYVDRPSLSAEAIGRLADAVHARYPDARVAVDNCYGEFSEEVEPCAVGADVVAGSWTKNPGGGIAPAGGYVAGRRDLVEAAAARLTAPGQGREVGAAPDGFRLAFQGLFLAPGAVAEAILSAVYASALFAAVGFVVDPAPGGATGDIVVRVDLGSPERVLAALAAIQAASPVDAHARPEAAALPGYPDPVAMAAGTFVQGGGLELSADAPMRPPFRLYVQGGLRFAASRRALDAAVAAVLAVEAAPAKGGSAHGRVRREG